MLWDGGIYEGQPSPLPVGATKSRSLALVGIAARSADDVVATLKAEWRARFGDQPPSALIGVSGPYLATSGSRGTRSSESASACASRASR